MSVAKPRKTTYHHGDLREALIEVGLAILREDRDPAALSLREAARRAGVSAMAPYRHFSDKDALLAAVAAVGYRRLGAALAAADEHPDSSEALVAQGVAYVAFACADPAMFRLMFGAALAAKKGELAVAAERSYAVMAKRVAAMVSPATAEPWALHCWATAHGLAALAIDGQLGDRDAPPAELADRILRLPGTMPRLPMEAD